MVRHNVRIVKCDMKSLTHSFTAGFATGKCTEETLRGKGPSTHVRIAEITPGRTIIQQRLAATCKDQPQ